MSPAVEEAGAAGVAEVEEAVVPQWRLAKLLLSASVLAETAAGARMQGPSRSESASEWPQGRQTASTSHLRWQMIQTVASEWP